MPSLGIAKNFKGFYQLACCVYFPLRAFNLPTQCPSPNTKKLFVSLAAKKEGACHLRFVRVSFLVFTIFSG
jgi:hypothetical protein